jgi:hypothetical protein
LPQEKPPPAVDYCRLLFQNITGWYHNADSKAQVLLGLDGAFLTFLTSSLLSKTNELKALSEASAAIFAVMCLTLAGSVVSAILCLWSRTYGRRSVERQLRELHVRPRRRRRTARK